MDRYTEKINKIKFNALRDRFEVKPYSQEWNGMRWLILFFSFILQIGTASMAGYLVFYGAQRLFGAFVAAVVAAVVFVGVFETAKRIWFNKVAKFAFQERLKPKHKTIIGIFITASILMSFFGTPLAVHDLAPRPSEPVRSVVVAQLDSLEAEAVSPWVDMAVSAKVKAEDIHAKNNWKGVTTRAARDEQLTFEAQYAKAQDSLTAISSLYAQKKSAAFDAAMQEHEAKMQESEAELQVIGWIFAGVCLALELLFLLCVWWLMDYSYHQYTEYLKDGLSTQEPPRAPSIKEKSKQELKKRAPKQEPKHSSIGFIQEGAVKNDGSKFVIYCESKGELRPYSKSELSRNISNCKGDRKEYWERMKSKLDNY